MEHTHLALAIQHVLIQSGAVALPGIGILRLRYHHARLNRQEGMIYPPSEVPEFEYLEDLAEPEPDLIREFLLAEKETDLAKGTARLNHVLARLRAVLGEGGTIELPEVGSFYSENGRIEFQPSSFNYYLEVFGLGPVQARPVMRRTAEQAARIAQESRAKVLPASPPVKMLNWRDRVVMPALAVVLVLALAGCIWLILAPPSALSDSAGPTDEQVTDTAIDEDTPRTDPGDLTEQILGEDPDSLILTEEVVSTGHSGSVPPDGEVTQGPERQERIRIVAGHFADPANARGLIMRLEKMGFNAASESGKGSLTRVVVWVDPKEEDPDAALSRIRADVEPTAWIDVK